VGEGPRDGFRRRRKRSKRGAAGILDRLTTLRILETKGYVKHKKEGRAFIYRPVVKREKAQDKALTHLLRRFFADSPELLVLNLLQTKMSSDELKRLRKRIEETNS